MNDEIVSFLIGAGVLILYLILSAWTEMGTKNPWKKDQSDKQLMVLRYDTLRYSFKRAL